MWREICLSKFGWMENEEHGTKMKGGRRELVGGILKEAAIGEPSRFYNLMRTFSESQQVLKKKRSELRTPDSTFHSLSL